MGSGNHENGELQQRMVMLEAAGRDEVEGRDWASHLTSGDLALLVETRTWISQSSAVHDPSTRGLVQAARQQPPNRDAAAVQGRRGQAGTYCERFYT
jgi:hypothetical protein